MAKESRYSDILEPYLKFEFPNANLKDNICLPQPLFVSSKSSTEDAKDFIHSTTTTIKMQSEGKLVAESISITYDGHSLHNSSLPSITAEEISFDDLPNLISKSEDEDAKKYIGMTKENWKNYLKIDSERRKASKLPIIQFGKYYKYRNSFKKYPIDWYILDRNSDGDVLLLSRDGLDISWWDIYSQRNETIPKWINCGLNRWLNDKFFSSAFSEEEKSAIKKLNKDCNFVFCLNKKEVQTYLENDPAMQMHPSDYAIGKGAFVLIRTEGLLEDLWKYEGNCTWWLRDEPTEEDDFSSFKYRPYSVTNSGEITDYYHDGPDYCVRPAIWVSSEYWKA